MINFVLTVCSFLLLVTELATGLPTRSDDCPAGTFKWILNDPPTPDNCLICLRGFYCPSGTPFPLSCPMGTMQPKEGSTSLSECTPCPAGKYCDGPGLSQPSGSCAAGYHCPSCSMSATPTATMCSAGHYCPEGSSVEVPCPSGTFGNTKGATSITDCVHCPPSAYCAGTGLVNPTGLCNAGYYCPGGNDVATPSANICPVGHYCVEGSSVPTPCPTGTFSNTSGITSSSECTVCPLGAYCMLSGSVQPTGDCNAGYYCPGGSTSPTPAASVCPSGHYCPTGSAFPIPCPAGSFGISVGAASCSVCPGGYYCSQPGLTQPSGTCSAGYVCPAGSTTPRKFMCPIGHYCPAGSLIPTPCPSGTSPQTTGMTSATDCAAPSS